MQVSSNDIIPFKSGTLFYSIIVLLISSLSFCAHRPATEPENRIIEHKLGNSEFRIHIKQSDKKADHVFVKLHDNEKTGERTAELLLQEYGGSFIMIENNNRRNISFRYQNKTYEFDPNRMFTEEGRKQTMNEHSTYHPQAAKELESLANIILNQLNQYDVVIALHNNYNNSFSIHDYKKKRRNEASEYFVNASMDPDDFIFTTDASIFYKSKQQNINAVLQHNNVKDDGSLSVYFAQRNQPYVNVETQHGHLEEQVRLTRAVLDMVIQ